MEHELSFEVLGPLVVRRAGAVLDPGRRKQRLLLIRLLLAGGRAVASETLREELWQDVPSAGAMASLHAHVSKLRAVLEPRQRRTHGRFEVLVTEPLGYALRAPRQNLDSVRFEDAVAGTRLLLSRNRPEQARRAAEQALAMWRGAALADASHHVFAAQETARLEELRQAARELLVTALLLEGNAPQAVVEAEALTTRYPLRETGWALLLRALYLAGRHPEALQRYAHLRRRLADELGLGPGRELRALHHGILHHVLPPLVVQGREEEPDTAVSGSHREPAAHNSDGRTGLTGPSDEMGSATTADAPTPTGSTRLPASAEERTDLGSLLRPTQLPGDLSVFAGRTTESAWLSAITATPERSRPAPPVVVVGGAPGIGKTTFAVHHAHQIAHLFPDGQLFVNLCGFHPHMPPVDPVDALHGFLAALGVPVQRVPEGLPARAALFRSLLAGRRVLIVLDNARDEEQVRPLLPSGPGCLTLITSRNQLPGLVTADGAKPLTLPLPSETEARETLARRLGSARLTAEPTATADLIRLCGRLPLALAVVTAHAALNPTFPLAAIADDLRHTHSRLDTLTTSDITTDVRAVFSWSYRSLEEPAARLFRLLALHPGPEITVPAAASLGGLPLPEARRLLAELTRARLVEQPLPGRYTLHDLLRDYATELIDAQGDAGERDDALLRVLDHYVFTAYAANRPLKRYSLPELDIDSPSTGVVPEEFTTPEQASRWLTTEQRVLSNLLHTAVSQGLEDHITGLAWSLEEHLHRQEHWPEAIAALTPALDVAQRRADRPTQGLCHRYLGEIHGRLGHQEQTMAHLRRATVLFEELGEANQQSLTHSTTAYVLNLFGRVEEALAAAEQALALARVAGDHVRVAMCLNNLAWLHSTSNRPEESLVYFEEAIGMLQDGDGSGIKAHFQDTLGYTLHLLNRYEEAVEAYRHALETYEKLGDHLHLIGSLMRLGDTHLAMGDREAARADWIRALDCADERQALSTSAQQVRDRLAALGGEASPAAVVPEGAHRRES